MFHLAEVVRFVVIIFYSLKKKHTLYITTKRQLWNGYFFLIRWSRAFSTFFRRVAAACCRAEITVLAQYDHFVHEILSHYALFVYIYLLHMREMFAQTVDIISLTQHRDHVIICIVNQWKIIHNNLPLQRQCGAANPIDLRKRVASCL